MFHPVRAALLLTAVACLASAEKAALAQNAPTTPTQTVKVKSQADLEADLAKLLSGATLEGSFTSTDPGSDPARLRTDKYTLGAVAKVPGGRMWIFQARMRDAMVPLPIPIEWAGNTPVISLDDFTIPGMGTFTARVMFFDGHYSGYWKHGDRGGLMFGVIRPPAPPQQPVQAAPPAQPANPASPPQAPQPAK